MSRSIISVQNLVKHFTLAGKRVVQAVDGINFDLLEGETLGIVGESGCGKSTTARLLMQLSEPTSGEILYQSSPVSSRASSLAQYRREVQMVFQDSYASLNPRLTVETSVAFGPRAQGLSLRAAKERAQDLLSRVGLEPKRFGNRYPHELSGGQRQRVNIARALAIDPRVVILDEAVAALDKSVEAQVINLLLDLKEEFKLTFIFISHDLNVVRYICDRVIVMYLGKIVEVGSAESIFRQPLHPYTEALVRSMPTLDPDHRTQVAPILGDPPSPINPPSGCRFHERCQFRETICETTEPQLTAVEGRHSAACFISMKGSRHSRSSVFATEGTP